MPEEIVTGWVERPIPAYTARPAGPVSPAGPAGSPRPFVVVGFEMFGVTGYVRRMAERIARLGYTAVAPDFYHRTGRRIELPATPEGRTRGLELVHGLTRDTVEEDMRATLAQADGPAAMVGLSVGGHVAYYAATRVPLDALVVFYPGWLTGTDIPLSRPEPTVTLTPELRAPVLFLIGEDDHLYPAAQREQIRTALRESGVRHEFVSYPDTPHGFFCDERDTYRPAAAEDAWARTTRFLKTELTR